MKRYLLWVGAVLILSGWVAFAIEHATADRKIAELQAKNTQLDSQLKAVQGVAKNLTDTAQYLDKTIASLQKMKEDIVKTKSNLDKASRTE
jgi:peptidoglycan hydrolase CwlO-like protein